MARVKIYTRKHCGYCTAALGLLDGEHIDYEHVDASGDDATRAWLANETGQSTVPQIFIDGKSVGGYTELAGLHRRGELSRWLAAPPVS